MKITNIRTKEITGKNYQTGEPEPRTIVNFTGGDGEQYSSFDEWLADVAEGQDVEGDVVIKEKDGRTFRNFKANKKSTKNVQLAAAAAAAPKVVPLSPAPKQQVGQEVWDRKDRQMMRMNALKAASSLYEGMGYDSEEKMIAFSNRCFAWLNGEPINGIHHGEAVMPPTPPLPEEEPF